MASISEMFSLKDRVALVTGGAGILGEQHCETLAELGAKVIMLDKDEIKGSESAEKISMQTGSSVTFKKVNLQEKDSIESIFNETFKDYGRIDILVNNAAAKSENFFEPFESFPLEDWREVMSVNLDAMFLCAQQAGRYMKANQKGSIINFVSIYGIVAPDQSIYEGSEYMGRSINTPAIYSASKGGVFMLTRYLASYWGKIGIRTNSITPGGIFSGQNDTFVKNYSRRCPLGRMGKRDEIKGAIAYLASDASSYVNGHNLVVDGGWSIW